MGVKASEGCKIGLLRGSVGKDVFHRPISDIKWNGPIYICQRYLGTGNGK